MRHCVFSAARSCDDAINAAIKAKGLLEMVWMCDNDAAECLYHSEFELNVTDDNFSLWLSNKDEHQLIADCMEFARANVVWHDDDRKNYLDLLCYCNMWQMGHAYRPLPKRAYELREWLKRKFGWPEGKRPPIEYMTWDEWVRSGGATSNYED